MSSDGKRNGGAIGFYRERESVWGNYFVGGELGKVFQNEEEREEREDEIVLGCRLTSRPIVAQIDPQIAFTGSSMRPRTETTRGLFFSWSIFFK